MYSNNSSTFFGILESSELSASKLLRTLRSFPCRIYFCLLLLFLIFFYFFLNFQRSNKYMDAKLKALKARNEYILSMDSANAAIHKYFVEDLSDIVDVSSES